jgi:hypothetical protein
MSKHRTGRTGYMRDFIKSYRTRIKEKAVAYKGGKCEECGYNKCLQALEFHHANPTAKEFKISRGSYGWNRTRAEIEKCRLLCCRCHREIHAELEERRSNPTVSKVKQRVVCSTDTLGLTA